MQRHRTRATRVLLELAAEALLYFGAWWLFVGELTPAELVLGGGALTLATVAAHVVGSQLGARFGKNPRPILQVRRLPGLVVSGAGDITAVLAKHLFTRSKAPSLLRVVHFAHAGTTSDDELFQALAITYTTISPNFVVIDVDTHARALVFHQLDPTPVPKMTVELGAVP